MLFNFDKHNCLHMGHENQDLNDKKGNVQLGKRKIWEKKLSANLKVSE